MVVQRVTTLLGFGVRSAATKALSLHVTAHCFVHVMRRDFSLPPK